MPNELKPFKCEFKPYCENDCESCEFIKDLKAQQDLEQAIQNIKNAIYEAFKPLAEKALETVKAVNEAYIRTTPNKRLQHLALHHKKKRVRKKNIHRICKTINKELYK